MLIAIDVGNTQTAIGLFEGDGIVAHWRISTDPRNTSDELHIKLRDLFDIAGFSLDDIDGIALSSVVPALTDLWDRVSLAATGRHAVQAGIKSVPWLPIAYEHPEEIGADRIADAVAAIESYGAPVVVVDLGTATNIEVIDSSGKFAGGIIAPGYITSQNALFNAAARIPRFDISAPKSVIGKTTRDAVSSGLLFGEVDKIDGLVRRVWDDLGCEAPVVGTGGLVREVAGYSKTITKIDENLTLNGLRIIYERNMHDGSDGK